MANDTDQPNIWTNQKAGGYEALWSDTVQPWGLEEVWQWENETDDIDNTLQDSQN